MAGVALSLFPWLESCSEKAKQEVQGEKAQIGIIGTGSRGLFHIKHLVQMPNVEVVALCDNYRPHLEDAAQYYPKAKQYDDYRRLLENKDVKGVIIARRHGERVIYGAYRGQGRRKKRCYPHAPVNYL